MLMGLSSTPRMEVTHGFQVVAVPVVTSEAFPMSHPAMHRLLVIQVRFVVRLMVGAPGHHKTVELQRIYAPSIAFQLLDAGQ